MPEKILFITTSNLASNPRLVKELQSLDQSKYSLQVIAFKLGNWGDKKDQAIAEELGLKITYLSASRKPLFNWLKWNILHRITSVLYSKGMVPLKKMAFISNKRSIQLCHYLNRHPPQAGLIIAHNLGALYPAYYCCERFAIPFQFDVEDYHPGEMIQGDDTAEKARRELLMKQMLPKAKAITFASPLIKKEVGSLIGPVKIPKQLINNSFWEDEFHRPNSIEGNLRLVWFSQFISHGRGLEELASLIPEFEEEAEFHFIGNPDMTFCEIHLNKLPNVYIHQPLAQRDLHQKLSEFDVGLALEHNKTDLNRQLCLTNKIFAYYQSGLYIIATDTPAQKGFIEESPAHGKSIKQDFASLRLAIKYCLENKQAIRDAAQQRFLAAKARSFEQEASKFVDLISKPEA